MNFFDVVGKSVPKHDAYEKVTGRAEYIADLKVPGLLYGSILHSSVPHGIITSIDTSEAEKLPGVKAVVTYEDAPDIPYTSCGHPFPYETPEDMRILNQHVRYIGDTIAAVAATNPETARKAVSLIKYEYKELPSMFTVEDALKKNAVEIHEGSHNLAGDTTFELGNVEEAFRNAAYIFEDEVDTPIIAHCQIETHISLVEEEAGSGRLKVHTANQCLNVVRERIAHALGRPMRDIQCVRSYVGGGFGGKQEPVFEIINCLLAMKCHKPVLLEATREENISMTRTRHAVHMKFRTALNENYQIIARDIEYIANTGAYSSHGHNIPLNVATACQVLYPTENLRYHGSTVYTNILIAGAMRAYGVPQWAFGMESHIDNMANALGMDPYDFRKINIYHPDKPYYSTLKPHSCGLHEMMEYGKEKIGWDRIQEEVRRRKVEKTNSDHLVHGVGMACGTYIQSCYPFSPELSVVRVRVHEDGFATVVSGIGDVGQGTETILMQIAAEALGIPYEWVWMPKEVDTDISPFDPGAYASRQTYVAGHACKKAALACKEDILLWAQEKCGKGAREDLDIKKGYLIRKQSGEIVCPLKEITMSMHYSKPDGHECVHEIGFRPQDNSLTYACAFAEVTVDTETGQVNVDRLLPMLDSGTIINPKTAAGQLYGGAVMSYGFGMTEQILVNPETGKVLNDNLLDYKVPTMADCPDMEGKFFETYEPTSAYGNKSMGEPPNIAPAAAIRNAIVNATGVKMNRGPLTPERVWSFLHPEEA